MIATILQSSKSFRAVRYNEDKVNEGGARLLEASNFPHYLFNGFGIGNNQSMIRKFFIDYSARNQRKKNPQFHVAISCEGKTWTDEQLLNFAHRWLKEMGYEGQPTLIYFHQDTDNNHLHIVTSRVGQDGKKINDSMERMRSRKIINAALGENVRKTTTKLLTDALNYRFTSVNQFKAICEAAGYECYTDNERLYLKKEGMVQMNISLNAINSKIVKFGEEDEKRRRQIYGIMKKYWNLSSNLSELEKILREQHGIALKFMGKPDSPYGYFVVDNHTKRVYNGSQIMKIKDLLNFMPADEMMSEINDFLKVRLDENPYLTTRDLNKTLRRYFGANLKGGVLYYKKDKYPLNEFTKAVLKRNDRKQWLSEFAIKTDDEAELMARVLGIEKSAFTVNPNQERDLLIVKNELLTILNYSENKWEFFNSLKESGYSLKMMDGACYLIDFKGKMCVNLDNELKIGPAINLIKRHLDKSHDMKPAQRRKAFRRKMSKASKLQTVRRTVASVGHTVSSAVSMASSVIRGAANVLGHFSGGSGGVAGGGGGKKKRRNIYDDDDDRGFSR